MIRLKNGRILRTLKLSTKQSANFLSLYDTSKLSKDASKNTENRKLQKRVFKKRDVVDGYEYDTMISPDETYTGPYSFPK